MSWNPEQYLRFAQPRLRPALDLAARVAGEPRTVVDLGCGPGNVTALLAARWPQAVLTGVDDSQAMLDQARATLPAVRWQLRSIAGWSAETPVDLLYSNAALHWLPEHAALFPHLAQQVAPGGWLAVQMPRNFEAPSHTAIADTVRAGPWRAALEPMLAPPPVAAPAFYHDALLPFADSVDLWETEYLQVLQGAEREAFEADYAARVAKAYPRRADGSTLFPFRRLFIVMRRK